MRFIPFRFIHVILGAGTALTVSSVSFADDLYVSVDGEHYVDTVVGGLTLPKVNDCEDAGVPCRSLKVAVSLAQAGDTIHIEGELDVSPQVINKELYIVGEKTALHRQPGLTVYGGRHFSVTANGHLTITGLTLEGGSSLEGGSIRTDGSVTLESCVVRDNVATGDGGAIYAGRDATVTITNCTFQNNDAQGDGGAIASHGATLAVSDATVDDNTGTNGGAIFVSDSTLTLDMDTVLSNNIANDSGGAIFATRRASVDLIDSSLRNNRAEINGGGVFFEGSTMYCFASSIEDNRAGDPAGAVLNLGGGIYLADSADSVDSVLEKCVLDANHADEGGGAYVRPGQKILIDQSSLFGNEAWGDGGAIWLRGDVEITNSTVFNNYAHDRGGAFFNDGNLSVVHGTLVANAAEQGPALFSVVPGMLMNTIIEASADTTGVDPDLACAGPNNGEANRIGADLTNGEDDSCGDPDMNLGRVTGLDTDVARTDYETYIYRLTQGSNATWGTTTCPLLVDQEDTPRDDGVCDIGSFEFTGT